MLPTYLKRAVIGAGLALAFAPAAYADQACLDSWAKDIQPIVDKSCVGCHQGASPAGKLSLKADAAPASLIGVKSGESDLPYVTPGDPAQSYLFHKINGTQHDVGGSGGQMPMGGHLADADIASIEAWITACTAP